MKDEQMGLWLERQTSGIPNIVGVIRMYRAERDMGFAEARDLAIADFRKRGWPIPESILRLEGRPEPTIKDKTITTY